MYTERSYAGIAGCVFGLTRAFQLRGYSHKAYVTRLQLRVDKVLHPDGNLVNL